NSCFMFADLAVLSPQIFFDRTIDLNSAEDAGKFWLGSNPAWNFCQNFSFNPRKRQDPRQTIFQNFLSQIQPADHPRFYFLHLVLPHDPLFVEPTAFYAKSGYPPLKLDNSASSRDKSYYHAAFQNHLVHAQYADYILGELIGRLKSLNLYDDTLLIV